jgi:DNA polymerase elongation subunit (family B)
VGWPRNSYKIECALDNILIQNILAMQANPSTRFHGRTIKYNQISQLAVRNEYLDPARFAKINDAIGKTQDILFMPNGVKETHMQTVKYSSAQYKILMWGVLQDGRRATVVLNGICPYFEIRVPNLPDGDEPGDFAEDLFKKLKNQPKTEPVKYEINTGTPFKYYTEKKEFYVRIYFDKSTFRAAAVRHVRSLGLETAHDDLSCYYRVVCRDRLLSFTSWMNLSNYTIGTDKGIKGSIFHVDIANYKEFTDDISNNSELLKDNSMVMTWDIETFSPDGQLPIPENPDHRMFMLASTFHWHHSTDALLRVCIVDQPCKPHKDYLTIVCESEERVIKAFGKLFEKMAPEFVIGFNDSDYDWPWLVTRASKTPGLLVYLAKCMDFTKPWKPHSDADILKFNFSRDKVKVEADSYAEGSSLQFQGYINLDVRTVFRQLYPTAEKSSLAWFLQANKLGGKKEMPYQEMFKIYRRMIRMSKPEEQQREESEKSDDEDDNEFAVKTRECVTIDDFAERMREVAEYCVIDAQRCQDLMKMRSVIIERREVSKVAYTTLYEAFFRANGSKVRNLVIARGQRSGLKISNITEETLHPEGKYPGAHVFAPRKGLVTSKLTMRERRDKARALIAQNLDITEELRGWLDIPDCDIEAYEAFIYKARMPRIDFSKDSPEIAQLADIPKCVKAFFEESLGRPITGLDFSSLYPSLIMTYNLSPEYMIVSKAYARELDRRGVKLHKIKFVMGGVIYRGWSVAHENAIDPADPNNKFGIYPRILKELFDNRKIMQKDLKKWEAVKEHMEAMPSDEFNAPENLEKYENVVFNYNCINSKQKALKVFMNTFYGETGNKNSPFFLLELAGGITSLGQKNIKSAHRFVTEAGCSTWYGDSVTGDTPLLVRLEDGSVDIRTIETLSEDQDWIPYENFKPGEPDRTNKEQRASSLKIWTDSGWANINRVIRHKTHKKMFRVATHIGCVDVTEDHSLLTASGEQIKPTEALHTELLHSFPADFREVASHITVDAAFEMGRQFDADSERGVPYSILNASAEIKQAFLTGVKKSADQPKALVVRGKLGAHGIFYLLKSIGEFHVSVEQVDDNDQYYIVVGHPDANPIAVKSLTPLPDSDGFVYDIETDTGRFGAGVGAMVLKNTDSLYISTPENAFVEADVKYYSGQMSKLDYWTELVTITFREINDIRDGVNSWFKSDNGTEFLRMAYEEALFPVTFLAKKKYYGIPHLSVPNFNYKHLFIRGLEVMKRGVSQFLRDTCYEIMNVSVSPANLFSLLELIHAKIKSIYAKEPGSYSFDDFVMTDVFKPNKQNVKVQTFARRMQERGIKVKPWERFNYVIVKKNPYFYDYRGRKANIGVGDKMELAAIAQEQQMEIDLDYYMEGSINGQLARLIVYSPLFYVEPLDSSQDEIDIAEKKIYNNASKYVENFCKTYYTNYQSKGAIYQKVFKIASKTVHTKIKQVYGGNPVMDLLAGAYDLESLEDWICEKAEKIAIRETRDYGKQYIEDQMRKVAEEAGAAEDSDDDDTNSRSAAARIKNAKRARMKEFQEVYFANKENLSKSREFQFAQRLDILRRNIKSHLVEIKQIFGVSQALTETLSENIKSILQIDSKYNESSQEVPEWDDIPETKLIDESKLGEEINEKITELASGPFWQSVNMLKFIFINLVSNYTFIHQNRSIVDQLKLYRDQAANANLGKGFDKKAFAKSAIDLDVGSMKF